MGRQNVWVGAILAGAAALGTALAGPPAAIPPADTPPSPDVPTVVKVEAGKPTLNGAELLPRSINAAREVLGRTRDYAGYLVRQERVNGVLQPEQTAELRVRMKPRGVNLRVVKPDALRGEETSYLPERSRHTVRFKPAGVEGVRGFQTHPADAPKVLAHTRHPASEVGLTALLDRVESIVATERALGHPAAIVASEYVFAGKPVLKCELFADIAHPARYAARVAVYFDPVTKLPVRFEAFDAPRAGEPGTLIEAQSYVGLTLNTGLGDTAFAR